MDDEEALRDLGGTLLKRFGYKVITASNGKEALEIYQREGASISLIILDLIMPEMDEKERRRASLLRLKESHDTILLKAGKFEPDEWETMKQHAVIGAKILGGSNSELLRAGEIIAISHQEKWDGSGYPNGLSGENIPLHGRIVAIADVFDALTSKRPYKEPFSNEKALAIMREGRGKHFDPNILDLFLNNFAEIEKIQSQYRDS